MAELPDALKTEATKEAAMVSEMFAAQSYVKKNMLEFQGMKMAGGMTIPAVENLVKDKTAVGDAFRYQLKTLKPGGLSDDDIKSVIEDPKGGKQQELIVKIVDDKGFYDNIATAMGADLKYQRVKPVIEDQLQKNYSKYFAEEKGKGLNDEAATKAVIAREAKLVSMSANTTHRFKEAVVQNTLLQIDGQKGLDAKQEAKLLDTNKQLYAEMLKDGIFAEANKPPTEAEYLLENGSTKYKKEHGTDAKPRIDKNTMLDNSTSSKAIAYLAAMGIDPKKASVEKTDGMVASVSASDRLAPLATGKTPGSSNLAV